jgi:hypothetical protein
MTDAELTVDRLGGGVHRVKHHIFIVGIEVPADLVRDRLYPCSRL